MTLNIPSEWTESWESYLEHKEEVVEFINNLLNADPMPKCEEQESILKEESLVVLHCIILLEVRNE